MIEYTANAEQDLDEILDFLLNESQSYAVKVMREIGKKLTLLEQNSKLGKPRNEILFNLRSFPAQRYTIFYILIENGIEVYRILHGSRDIEGVFDEYFEGLEE